MQHGYIEDLVALFLDVTRARFRKTDWLNKEVEVDSLAAGSLYRS